MLYDPVARDFNKRWNFVMERYADREFLDALELALEIRESFPEKFQGEISLGIACIYTRLGQLDNAVHGLEKAMGDGHWWSKSELLQIPALEPLRERADFNTLVDRCEALQHSAQASSKPDLLVFPPPSGLTRSTTILIALHGRGEMAQNSAPYWKAALSMGVLLACPGSSQPYGRNGFCWDDRERARMEVAKVYSQLRASHLTDPNQTIVAGYSQGGELALSLALTPEFPCKGFIAIAPGPFSQTNFEGLTKALEQSVQRGLRGCLFTGEKDPTYAMTMKMYKEMVGKGMLCEFTADPLLGHDFPSDFEGKLVSSIKFILG